MHTLGVVRMPQSFLTKSSEVCPPSPPPRRWTVFSQTVTLEFNKGRYSLIICVLRYCEFSPSAVSALCWGGNLPVQVADRLVGLLLESQSCCNLGGAEVDLMRAVGHFPWFRSQKLSASYCTCCVVSWWEVLGDEVSAFAHYCSGVKRWCRLVPCAPLTSILISWIIHSWLKRWKVKWCSTCWHRQTGLGIF